MTTGVLERIGIGRACLFVLGNKLFAVEVSCAREVVVLEDYTVVPLAPSHLVGVANFRGHILPILDIRPLLRLPVTSIGRGTKALVVEAAHLQAAVAIEGVLGLESLEGADPLEETALREYGGFGMGFFQRGDTVVTLLNAVKILEALRIAGTSDDIGSEATGWPTT